MWYMPFHNVLKRQLEIWHVLCQNSTNLSLSSLSSSADGNSKAVARGGSGGYM